MGLDGTGGLRHPPPSQVAFSLQGESSAVFASRADGALQGPKEGSRSGTPKWGFKATAGGGLRREECGGWGGRFEGEAGAGSQKMEPGWEGEREGNAFLSGLQGFWPPGLREDGRALAAVHLLPLRR